MTREEREAGVECALRIGRIVEKRGVGGTKNKQASKQASKLAWWCAGARGEGGKRRWRLIDKTRRLRDEGVQGEERVYV